MPKNVAAQTSLPANPLDQPLRRLAKHIRRQLAKPYTLLYSLQTDTHRCKYCTFASPPHAFDSTPCTATERHSALIKGNSESLILLRPQQPYDLGPDLAYVTFI